MSLDKLADEGEIEDLLPMQHGEIGVGFSVVGMILDCRASHSISAPPCTSRDSSDYPQL
jgi:hypothetical protein